MTHCLGGWSGWADLLCFTPKGGCILPQPTCILHIWSSPCLLPAEVLHFASQSPFLFTRWMQLIHESSNQANKSFDIP